MTFPLYTALTAGEFSNIKALPERPGWMACHFSSYGTDLTNLPRWLPPNAMLIVNDRTPVCGHDAGLIKDQILQLIESFSVSRILLDFQRADSPEAADIVNALVENLPCPVGVTEIYAEGLNCPVFVTLPIHTPLSCAISRWEGRKLWLEAALDAETITVTPTGSRFTFLPKVYPPEACHHDANLHCHYQISVTPQQAEFTLFRTPEDLVQLLESAKTQNFACAVGLYQELQNTPALLL